MITYLANGFNKTLNNFFLKPAQKSDTFDEIKTRRRNKMNCPKCQHPHFVKNGFVNSRLIVAPPLGRYSVSERFYQVLNPAHPGLNNNDVLQGLTCNLPYTIRLVRVRLNQEMIEVVFLPSKLKILYKMLNTKSSLLINNLISRLHPTS